MIKTLSKSLMLKIVILGLSLVLCSSFIMQYFAYESEKNAIEGTIGATALDITNSVLNQIDVTKFEELRDVSDMEDEYYISLRNELNNIKSYTGLKFLYTMRKTENGDYIYVVDGADMEDEDASLLGDVEEEMTDKMADSFNGNAGFEISDNATWGKLVSAFIPIKDGQGKTVGMLGADFPADSAFENLKKSKDMMLMTAALIAILGIPVSGLFAYLIIRSLKQLQHKIKLVEGGNLTIKVDNQRGDEVGVLSRAFQTMLESMAAMIRSIRNYSGQIVEHVKNLNQNVNDSNEKTEEINIIINEIAQGANEQAENFDNVTNLMEQVHGEIIKLNLLFEALGEDSVKTKSASLDVTDVLKGSVKQINLVNDIVDNTADMVKNLETKFEEIRSFSDIVSEIAEQTDLLALNASIEAARAGEQGRGFGVVAEEIKKLAKQSNEASEQITGLIRKMQQDINESNTYIQSGVIQSRDGVKEITKVEDFLGHLSGEYDKLDVKIKNCTAALGNIELDSNHILSNIKVLNEISQNFSNHTQVTALAMDEQREIMADIRVKLSSVKEMVEELDFAASKFAVD